MYGWWDSFPGRPEGRERWFHHLDLYRPMAVGGSRAWIEIGDNTIIPSPIPHDVTASLFVNDEIYLVLANCGDSPIEVASQWTWRDRESEWTGQTLSVAPRSLRYLKRESPARD